MEGFTQLQAAADDLADAVKHAAGSAPIANSVTSRTSRGVGTVRVSVVGRLLNIELTSAAMELSPDQLAAAIQAAYATACQDATDQARTLIRDTTRDHPQLGGFFNEFLPDEISPSERPEAQPDDDDHDDWPTIRG